MNKLMTINIKNLRTTEDFSVMQRIADITDLLTDDTDKKVVDSFKAAVAAFDEVLNESRASEFTAVVRRADKLADKAWRAISNTLKIEVGYPSADVRKAASEGLAIVKKYGDFTRKGYSEEYGKMHSALQNFAEMGTEKQRLCYIDGWVEELQTRYDEFTAARAARNAEDAERRIGIVKLRREKCDAEFRHLCNYVSVMMKINGEEPYAPFVSHANSIIADAKQILAARNTRKAGSGSSDEGD